MKLQELIEAGATRMRYETMTEGACVRVTIFGEFLFGAPQLAKESPYRIGLDDLKRDDWEEF